MRKVILAFQFLTILPLGPSQRVEDADIGGSSSWFVMVGLFQGILLLLADYLSGMVFHPDLVIAVVLFVLVFSNGGFHLDGLADTFDALSVKTTGDIEKDREKRLAVMKDGSVGPMGATAIFFALAFKYLALRNISNFTYFTYYSSLLLMPAASKFAMVAGMTHGRPARKNGLGSVFIRGTGGREMAISGAVILLPLVPVALFSGRYVHRDFLIFFPVALFSLYLFSRLWSAFSDDKFGGLTGDTLGALSESAEIVFLFMVIGWSRLFT